MRIRGDHERTPFDFLTIAFHWLTAGLISFQAMSGLLLQCFEGKLPQILDFHRSAGTAVWCIALMRLVWRATFAKFPQFPDSMSNIQRWLVSRSEQLLYALLLIQPVTGLVMTLLLGEPFQLFVWTVPALVSRNLHLWATALTVHRVGAYCLFAMVGAHAARALAHHYLLRDDVLEMMAPWMKRFRRPAENYLSSPADPGLDPGEGKGTQPARVRALHSAQSASVRSVRSVVVRPHPQNN